MSNSTGRDSTRIEEQDMRRENVRKYVVENYKFVKENCQSFRSLNYIARIGAGCFVEFECIPFEAGSLQLAFKGELFKSDDDDQLRPTGHRFVVKVPQMVQGITTASLLDRFNWLKHSASKSVERHRKAIELAREFNGLKVSKKVEIAETKLARIIRVPEFNGENGNIEALIRTRDQLRLGCLMFDGSHVTVEAFITGNFVKYLNNDGNLNSSSSVSLPSAFAHWTWQRTAGKMMVCDIQGVRKPTKYILTDPCVHSAKDCGFERFGPSDLGEEGMLKFFQKHECNNLCKDLWLENIRGSNQSLDEVIMLATRKNEESFIKNMRFDILSWSHVLRGNPTSNFASDSTTSSKVLPEESFDGNFSFEVITSLKTMENRTTSLEATSDRKETASATIIEEVKVHVSVEDNVQSNTCHEEPLNTPPENNLGIIQQETSDSRVLEAISEEVKEESRDKEFGEGKNFEEGKDSDSESRPNMANNSSDTDQKQEMIDNAYDTALLHENNNGSLNNDGQLKKMESGNLDGCRVSDAENQQKIEITEVFIESSDTLEDDCVHKAESNISNTELQQSVNLSVTQEQHINEEKEMNTVFSSLEKNESGNYENESLVTQEKELQLNSAIDLVEENYELKDSNIEKCNELEDEAVTDAAIKISEPGEECEVLKKENQSSDSGSTVSEEKEGDEEYMERKDSVEMGESVNCGTSNSDEDQLTHHASFCQKSINSTLKTDHEGDQIDRSTEKDSQEKESFEDSSEQDTTHNEIHNEGVEIDSKVSGSDEKIDSRVDATNAECSSDSNHSEPLGDHSVQTNNRDENDSGVISEVEIMKIIKEDFSHSSDSNQEMSKIGHAENTSLAQNFNLAGSAEQTRISNSAVDDSESNGDSCLGSENLNKSESMKIKSDMPRGEDTTEEGESSSLEIVVSEDNTGEELKDENDDETLPLKERMLHLQDESVIEEEFQEAIENGTDVKSEVLGNILIILSNEESIEHRNDNTESPKYHEEEESNDDTRDAESNVLRPGDNRNEDVQEQDSETDESRVLIIEKRSDMMNDANISEDHTSKAANFERRNPEVSVSKCCERTIKEEDDEKCEDDLETPSDSTYRDRSRIPELDKKENCLDLGTIDNDYENSQRDNEIILGDQKILSENESVDSTEADENAKAKSSNNLECLNSVNVSVYREKLSQPRNSVHSISSNENEVNFTYSSKSSESDVTQNIKSMEKNTFCIDIFAGCESMDNERKKEIQDKSTEDSKTFSKSIDSPLGSIEVTSTSPIKIELYKKETNSDSEKNTILGTEINSSLVEDKCNVSQETIFEQSCNENVQERDDDAPSTKRECCNDYETSNNSSIVNTEKCGPRNSDEYFMESGKDENSQGSEYLSSLLNSTKFLITEKDSISYKVSISESNELNGFEELATLMNYNYGQNRYDANDIKIGIISTILESRHLVFLSEPYDRLSETSERRKVANAISKSDRLGNFSLYLELKAFAEAFNAEIICYNVTLKNDKLVIENSDSEKFVPACYDIMLKKLKLARFEFEGQINYFSLSKCTDD